MSDGSSSKGVRLVATGAAALLSGSFALGFLASTISEKFALYKKKKYGKSCLICKAIGYYTCKLCKGNGTIQWSPMYDPVVINPCVCPLATDSRFNAVLTAWEMALHN